jgi:hypothetical protein
MAFKRAKVKVDSVELQCPHCDATKCQTHSGSTYWTLAELPPTGTIMKCDECDKEFVLPKIG